LIALRRDHAALRDGDYERADVRYSEDSRWLVVRRRNIAVACNLADRPALIPMDGIESLLLASSDDVGVRDGAVTLPAESVAVLRVREAAEA
jgi:maltooligosyltrehalose trehalohydrolase